MFRRSVQVGFLLLFFGLLFHVCCPYPTEPGAIREGFPSHYSDHLAEKERFLPAELFLMLDPSVAIASSIAGRSVSPALFWALAVIALGIVVPRCFCGYVCPLGTIFDALDHVNRFFRRLCRTRDSSRRKLDGNAPWFRLQYFFLAAMIIAALFGVSLAGYIAPIPVLTRTAVFLVAPFQTAWYRGWYQVPIPNAGFYLSVALFLGFVAVNMVRHRFWCRNLCPSGACFSLFGTLRLFGKKVDTVKCNRCSRCVASCPFGAVEAQKNELHSIQCTTCMRCQTDCPQGAVSYGPRNELFPNVEKNRPTSRRKFLRRTMFGAGGLFATLTAWTFFGKRLSSRETPIRPPGSVPEDLFLQRCVRCGECLRACPNDALQPYGLDLEMNRLWTPQLVADWSGCEPSCNNCGKVCPTGAIRNISLEEKRACKVGLAVINKKTCLPFAGKEDCQLCVEECQKAGYHAIEFQRTGTEVDEMGEPIEGTGFLAPVVLADKCVGCGLCQTRCRAINVAQKKYFHVSAIQVLGGNENEDRLAEGSYRALREQNKALSPDHRTKNQKDDYLPDFIK